MTSKNYKLLEVKLQKIADINYATALLHWDKETYMPKKAAALRSQQLSTLSELGHSLFTEKSTGILLNKLEKENLNETLEANVKRTKEDYDKMIKLPGSFVAESSMLSSKAFHAWIEARKKNDFKIFEDPLDKLISHKRKEADLLGFSDHPYDALLDLYEPGLTVSTLNRLFKNVREQLVPFVAELRSKKQIDTNFLFLKYPSDKQWNFGIDILKNIGYDFDAGRQDISEHPFTINFGSTDVRVTTRIDEYDFSNMTWSCIHEGGHALYEQGLPIDQYGLPCGSAASLSIHESQSRLWENMVGRGKNFWKFHYPKLQKIFPKNLSNISLDHFYKAINHIEPNYIRTEADELHYHFHVMIRYEIEKSIMEGLIKTSDLRDYWNARYKEYLNVDVPSDLEGILQDIHWSHGSFGYFPTYSLGSFYAAQFYEKAKADITNLEKQIESGNSSELLHWLRNNIHAHGRKYLPNELCKQVTGSELSLDPFMDYVKLKYSEIAI
ncbi:MAG: carboxypeptidase M32 [Saprospiraceae bacterium]|nr:carboxypeptidase M32 [Saprospiraceae bacterium]